MKSLTFVAAFLPLVASAVQTACESMRVVLDETANGAVRRIVSAGGADLASARGQVPLFSLLATRVDDFTKSVTVEPGKDTRCDVSCRAGVVELTYTGLGDAAEKVVCTVRPDGKKLRWNIRVAPKPGWAIERTVYPRILTAARIGSAGEDDAVVAGTAKGGLCRNPVGRGHCHVNGCMPGSLVCQFACHYDDSALFYYAAEDGLGYAKTLQVDSHPRGVAFKFAYVSFEEKPFALPYDIVTACLDGTKEKPTLWQDAADLYRAWAWRQAWCGKPLRDREDLPRWMRDAPAMVRFGRDWLVEPDQIRAWMKGCWRARFDKAPLVTAFWGWERHGYWVSDYFPVFPSNEKFAALVKDIRALDAHAFPWPSGYYWILDYNKKKDGTFAFTDYENYKAANGDAYCCIKRDGTPYRRTPRWLDGGTSTCLCGGTQFCQDWWNKSICLPLAKLGCEMIQADQTVGGAFPACWSRTHGHAPGEGLWKRNAFHRQLVTMRETMRAVEPESVVCYEEPCEIYNDLVGIQDYRSGEARSDEWASVFNYVYHEFLPCFQSNPRWADRVWRAHEAADGQMPHLTPFKSDLQAKPDAARAAYLKFMRNWVSVYHGRGRDWLAHGRQIRPPVIDCATVPFKMSLYGGAKFEGRRPAVFHSAWESQDGRQALVFVNATDSVQTIGCRWRGEMRRLDVKPDEVMLLSDAFRPL